MAELPLHAPPLPPGTLNELAVGAPPEPPREGPRWLYLHGFASGPESSKGVALAAHYEARKVHLERLNLRIPSFERLRLSSMIHEARERIGGDRDRAVLFGSSLGGLCASRVAEEDPRVIALVLLAPAFLLPSRWRKLIGEEKWQTWQRTGWLETEDYVEKRMSRVDFGFIEDLEVIDKRAGLWPDVRVPTLVVHGQHDAVIGIDGSREWARGKRHVRLIEVDDGHELVRSIPRIKEEADAFLAGLLNG